MDQHMLYRVSGNQFEDLMEEEMYTEGDFKNGTDDLTGYPISAIVQVDPPIKTQLGGDDFWMYIDLEDAHPRVHEIIRNIGEEAHVTDPE